MITNTKGKNCHVKLVLRFICNYECPLVTFTLFTKCTIFTEKSEKVFRSRECSSFWSWCCIAWLSVAKVTKWEFFSYKTFFFSLYWDMYWDENHFLLYSIFADTNVTSSINCRQFVFVFDKFLSHIFYFHVWFAQFICSVLKHGQMHI